MNEIENFRGQRIGTPIPSGPGGIYLLRAYACELPFK